MRVAGVTCIDSIEMLEPPTVAGIELNVGEEQRSVVDSLVVTIDGNVQFADGAVAVEQRSNRTEPTFVPVTTSVSQELVNGQTIATIQFESLTRNSENALEDGNYQLTLVADLVTRGGVPLNEDFVFGDEETDGFYALFGDSDGNRGVDIFDLLAFRRSFRTVVGDTAYEFFMDFDAGDSIDIFDLLQFRTRFRAFLPFDFGSSPNAPSTLRTESVTSGGKVGTRK